MSHGTIHSRLAAAASAAGIADADGVLAYDDEEMPLCDALRLAEACGMDTGDLLGQPLVGTLDHL